MKSHVAALGIIHLVLGGLAVLGGLTIAILGMGGGLAAWLGGGEGSGAAGGLLTAMGWAIGGIIAGGGALGVLTGYGIMARRGWGRILGIIASALNVLSLLNLNPVGLLGVYGFWVLLSKDGAAEFENPR